MSPLARRIAHILAGHAARRLPEARAAWGDPMRAEVDAIENDLAALHWAAGCLIATYGERTTFMKTISLAPLFGTLGLTVVVFGGFILSGGPMYIIAEAFPTLFITIALGAIADTSILSSNGGPGVFTSLGRAFRGRRFHATDYEALADMLGGILAGKQAVTRTDPAACLLADAKLLMDRSADSTPADVAPVDLLLQGRIATVIAGERRGVDVLELLARCLLWFSAMAFVLGLTKILQEVGHAPDNILALMLAHAVVAPLLGIFLAAGIVFPLSRRLEAGASDDANIYSVIRTAVLTRLTGVDAATAVRIACGGLPADLRGSL